MAAMRDIREMQNEKCKVEEAHNRICRTSSSALFILHFAFFNLHSFVRISPLQSPAHVCASDLATSVRYATSAGK